MGNSRKSTAVKNKNSTSAFSVPVLFQRELSFKLAAFLLVSIVFAFYAQTFNNPIVFDTAQTFNDKVLNGYFDNTTWYSFLTSRWLPLFTFGATYKLASISWGWHRLINIMMHAGNSVLVFYLVNLVLHHFSRRSDANINQDLEPSWCAFFGAVIFALNPVSIYATAYLIQRTSLFMTFFSLLALISYFFAITKQNRKLLGLTLLCYYLSFLSKEHGIMLPAVLVVFHFLIERISFKEFIRKYSIFYLIMACITAMYVFKVTQLLGQVYEPHGEDIIESANIRGSVLTEKSAYPLSLITQMSMFFRYLYLWFVPDWRNIYIDIHLPFATKFISFPETLYVVLYLCFPVVCYWLLTRSNSWAKTAGFGFGAIWVYFMPEMSVVRLSEQFVLYRSYLWMSMAAFVWPIFLYWKNSKKTFFNIKLVLLLAYLVMIVVVNHDRMNTFDSDIALWRDNVNKMKNIDASAMYKGYRPYNNLAFALTSAGYIDESIQYYYQALQINPKYVKARSNLGAVLTNRGRFQEAIEHFKKALEFDPEYVDAHVGIGVCAAEQGFTEEAIEHYMDALKVKPEYPDALFNMGNAYLKLKQYEKAADLYKRAIAQKPNFPDSYHNLGIALSNLGRYQEAKQAFEGAQKIDPHHQKSKDALNLLSKQLPNLK